MEDEPAPIDAPWLRAVDEYLASCEAGLPEWRAGQVGFPGTLTVDIGDVETYVATLDIRQVPELPARTIPGDDPESEPVYIQCAVAARLVTAGDNVQVSDSNWELRTFTPSGVVDWSWSVTGKKIGDQDVRLQLQPAVQANGELYADSSGPQTASFVTEVTVDGSWLQEVQAWVEENMPAAAAIAALLAGAVLALLKWGSDMIDAVRGLLRKWRGNSDELPDGSSSEAGDGDPPSGETPARRRQRRRQRAGRT